MSSSKPVSAHRVGDEKCRLRALKVLREVYRGEKAWVTDPDSVFPLADLERPEISWFLAELGGRPVGTARVLYDLPLHLYKDYGLQLVDQGIDVEAFLRHHRIAEIGRFAVRPRFRRRIRIAAALMAAATTETVQRGFTHYITDVFEGDPNSPYQFHRGVLGFQVVATHETGELRFDGRRITMLLDIRDAYQRLARGKNWIFRYITASWTEQMVQQLLASAPGSPVR